MRRLRAAQPHAVDVCHVITLASRTGAYGGPLSVVLDQLRMRKLAGLSSTVYAGALRGDELHGASIRSVEVRPLIRGSGFPLLFSWAMARALTRAVRESRCIHVSFARELIPIWAALLAVIMRRKLIIQPHGMLTVGSGSSRIKSLLDVLVVGPLIKRAATIVALTQIERNALARKFGLPHTAFTVIGNGLNLALEPYASSKPRLSAALPQALFCARLHPRKRVVDFIAAAEQLGDRVKAVVVGPDGGELDIVLKAQSRGIVSYEPPVEPDQVANRVNAATVFVLPSESEPFGNVLVTALALHIPVVVTQSADLAALISSAEAGIVVQDRCPEELASAVSRILGNDEDYARFSRNAGILARREFSQAVTGPLLLQISGDGPDCV